MTDSKDGERTEAEADAIAARWRERTAWQALQEARIRWEGELLEVEQREAVLKAERAKAESQS